VCARVRVNASLCVCVLLLLFPPTMHVWDAVMHVTPHTHTHTLTCSLCLSLSLSLCMPQLTIPQQTDREAKPKPAAPRRRSAARLTQFKPTITFDDGTTGPTERSTTQIIIRKLAKMTKRQARPKEEPSRDLRAELGVLRIYADIWNLVTTYKCKRASPMVHADLPMCLLPVRKCTLCVCMYVCMCACAYVCSFCVCVCHSLSLSVSVRLALADLADGPFVCLSLGGSGQGDT
jgi:hypothetical protein